MDSTYNTCIWASHHQCYLCTRVTRSSTTGKGVPVCFMLTNSEAIPAIEYWLRWIKDDLNYSPERVMTDNSQTEMGAIRNTFGRLMWYIGLSLAYSEVMETQHCQGGQTNH